MTKRELERPPQGDPTERSLWGAAILDFAEAMFRSASEEERMSLDRTGGDIGFCEDALRLACQNPEKFRGPLGELITHLAFMTDKILFDPIHLGGLHLDRFGEIVVSQRDSAEIDAEYPDRPPRMVPTRILMLTGPQKGRYKEGGDIDIVLPNPQVVRGEEEN